MTTLLAWGLLGCLQVPCPGQIPRSKVKASQLHADGQTLEKGTGNPGTRRARPSSHPGLPAPVWLLPLRHCCCCRGSVGPWTPISLKERDCLFPETGCPVALARAATIPVAN